MTDGGIILSEDQGEYKRFDVQDGMGITMIRKAGLTGIFGRFQMLFVNVQKN